MKYPSITTPDIEHDSANLLAEFIWLNRDIRADTYPWGGQNSKEWGRLVAVFKKLMGDSYGLSAEQLAFYVWKCKPNFIDPKQFAKMVAVARRLFEHMDLEQVTRLYHDRRKHFASSGLESITYKKEKPKNLFTFLRELESGKIT